ncbi:hypothetical protein DSECCO2_655220 [anaerobic digester metagenome]
MLCERAAQLFAPVGAFKNGCDFEKSGGIGCDLCAQKASTDSLRHRAVTTADIGVTYIQFADKLTYNVIQIMTVIHIRQQDCVFVAHGIPVDFMHVFNIEEIAHLAIYFKIYLRPFFLTIDRCFQLIE